MQGKSHTLEHFRVGFQSGINVAVHCNVLQCVVAVCCNVLLQHVAVCVTHPQAPQNGANLAVCCSVL